MLTGAPDDEAVASLALKYGNVCLQSRLTSKKWGMRFCLEHKNRKRPRFQIAIIQNQNWRIFETIEGDAASYEQENHSAWIKSS
jgi:hypothetical protein